MEFIGKIFLFFAIIIPLFFIVTSILRWKKIRRKRKLKIRILCAIILSFSVNFTIYSIINNSVKDKNKTVEVKKVFDENNTTTKKMDDDVTTTTTTTKETTTKSTKSTKKTSTTTTTTKKPEKKKTSNGFEIVNKDGVTYVDGYMIVNKTYSLPSDYIPKNTHKKVTNDTTICSTCIVKDAYDAFVKMKEEASKSKINLYIQSGYRSYSYQNGLYNMYVKKDGKDKADTYSARPGNSEHQSGYAMDLNSVDVSFANTKEGKWLNTNAYKYGFILRYPKDKDHVTGYSFEPWHYRYVGTNLSEVLYNNGNWLTMEEYFGITSRY